MMPSRTSRLLKAGALAVTAVLIVGTVVEGPAAAATIAGQRCSKVGITRTSAGIRYRCTRVNGKLVWKRVTPKWAAPIPIKLPIPASTDPNAITFANIADRVADIPQAAWDKSQEVLNKNSAHRITIDLHVGPNTKLDFPQGEAQIREGILRTAKMWNGFSQSSYITVMAYNATDEPWAEQVWLAAAKARGYSFAVQAGVHDIRGQCQSSSAPGQTSGPITECRGSNTGSVFDSSDAAMELGMTGNSTDPYFLTAALVSHEYTHAAQAGNWIGSPSCHNVDGHCFRSGMSNSGFSPCWLFEGLPNSASRLIMANDFSSYQTLRAGLPYGWGPTTVTDYTQPSLRNYLFNQSPSTCYQNGQLYKLGYSIGALTTEALVAIGGPQAVMSLYALGARGYTFPTAFQKVYSISWSEASTILSKVLATEYSAAGPAPQ